jgi:hypothetical protein
LMGEAVHGQRAATAAPDRGGGNVTVDARRREVVTFTNRAS